MKDKMGRTNLATWSLERCNDELGAAGHYSLHNDVREAREAVLAMMRSFGIGFWYVISE